MVSTYLGRNCREFREAKGWSQRELARRVGISSGHMNQIEKASKGISLDNAVRIAEALDVTLTDLLEHVECRHLTVRWSHAFGFNVECTECGKMWSVIDAGDAPLEAADAQPH